MAYQPGRNIAGGRGGGYANMLRDRLSQHAPEGGVGAGLDWERILGFLNQQRTPPAIPPGGQGPPMVGPPMGGGQGGIGPPQIPPQAPPGGQGPPIVGPPMGGGLQPPQPPQMPPRRQANPFQELIDLMRARRGGDRRA